MNADHSSDNDSDLDMNLEELARRPCKGQQANDGNNLPTPSQVTMDLDDGSDTDDVQLSEQSQAENDGHYGLRRRRAPINYKGMSQDSDDDFTAAGETLPTSAKKFRKLKPRDILYVSSLFEKTPTTLKQMEKFIKNPERVENLPKWRMDMRDVQINHLDDPEHFELLQKFVKKCGRFLDQLIFVCDPEYIKPPRYWSKLLELLTIIFNAATFLKKFSMKYHKEGRENREQIIQILNIIKNSEQKSLNSLELLPLVCGTSASGITESELNLIVELAEEGQISWEDVELGDGLLVFDDKFGVVKSVEKLLEVNRNTLQTLRVHGGLKGHPNVAEDKSKQKIHFPRSMPKLTELTICPKYSFVSETLENRNPTSKRWREIKLDDISSRAMDNEEDGELNPLKVCLSLEDSDFPGLEKVVLGNLVEFEVFSYALMRKLKIFRCGSRWDLAVRFPKFESKKGSSNLQELQLPDGLKDPFFVEKVGKFFPHLSKVWIFLPSVPALRTFFKAFENSSDLEELYLKTQFDFETTMESCLLPQLLSPGNGLSDSSKTVIATLKQYKHFADYVHYHNIELPLEDEEDLALLRRSSAGIRALKSLKVLDLEHIPRKVLIPNPEDERRWYDHNFKYLNTTFGFGKYPFSRACHQEIMGMNLREYQWKLFDVPDSCTRQFSYAGYTPISRSEMLSSDDENLFTPVSRRDSQNKKTPSSSRRASSKGVKVAVKPSMFIQKHFDGNKTEK